mmetsp:Transcript_20947/g.63065  ORF Transcript_20947/g.63065 Transcript_20947/m.63065 type:complete len:437 (-) Transcript_20947:2176-3486(-)
MVDDVGGEDADAHAFSKLLGFPCNRHIECQDDRKLLGSLFEHDRGAHDVLLVNGADVNAGHGDLHRVALEEREQCFQRTQRGCLHTHPFTALVDGGEYVGHVGHDLLLQSLDVVPLLHHQQLRAGDSAFKAVGCDLDALGSLDLLVVQVRSLHPQFLHGVGGEQGSDVGDDGGSQAAHHDLSALPHGPIHQHHVHGGAQPLNHLHLQHGGLQLVHKLEALHHHALCQFHQQLQQIRDAFAGDGRGGHDVDELTRVRIFPVQCHVQALLVEIEFRLVVALSELCVHMRLLSSEAVLDGSILVRRPIKQPVNLVKRDDEGRLALLEQVDGLDGLRLQPVHEVHHQDGDVTQAAPAGPQVGERLVTWGVDDEQTGHAEVKGAALAQALGAGADVVAGDVGGPDLLCDAARLPVLYVGPPHVVQNLCLPCVDVTQDAADG